MSDSEKNIGLNVAFYGNIYRKCLAEAEKIAEEKKYTRQETFEITTVMFKQFFSDQTAIAGQVRQTESVMAGLSSVFQGRGR